MKGRQLKDFFVLMLIVGILGNTSANGQTQRHFSDPLLLPLPQKVSLLKQHFEIMDGWVIIKEGDTKQTAAQHSLVSQLKERFGLDISDTVENPKNEPVIHLVVKANSVNIANKKDSNDAAIMDQAYQIQLDRNKIIITANAEQGLFYGVQTLIQLLEKQDGHVYYPTGSIEDWPDLEMRMVYWDDAHHLEYLDALKDAIRQAAFYKINAISIKLEGHFEFSSAKPVIEPYAYTAKEYIELTDYAAAHFVQLIPYLDAPAHISFILKHPEYYHLRSFPHSNYELSVTNPEADKLITGMFDDLINANPGGKYVLFSTDEAYYVGKSPSEKDKAHVPWQQWKASRRLYNEDF